MKSSGLIYGALAVAFLSGCASTDVKQLRHERDVLSAELAVKKDRIGDLENQNRKLEDKLIYQKKVGKNLEKEKTAQAEETSIVRREARVFVQEQMGTLREFSENKELLDYVGGEPINRTEIGGENLLLVDMKNLIQTSGTLLGGKVFAKSKTNLSFCILRPQGNNLVVLWISKPATVPKGGLFRVTFDVPVAAEKGDLIGLFSSGKLQIPFDYGTGDTRTIVGPVTVGKVIPIDDLEDGEKRTYSFGVSGFLDY